MILKIILGSGGRSLLSYLSQPQKAPVHHPQNNQEIYGRLHLPDPDWHPSRRGQPTSNIKQLLHLPELNVVNNIRNTSSVQGAGGAGTKNHSQVFLPDHARDDLVGRAASDAIGMRRPGGGPGTAPAQKSGGRRIEKASAPPTFSTFAGTTPREISAEFGALRKLKQNLGKAVGHLILAPGPEDRELTKEEWKRALDLALAEHGASDAPHAAWLHDDTDHQHLHIFFSRITHTGKVISDSLSYQKNRSASLKITQELKLTPLSDTLNQNAPGDRETLQNATRRADRRSEDGQINAADIRAAVAIAIDLADLERRLAEIGVEAEFQKRGQEQTTYGWKVRKIGQVEWLKASTLAKDLSWPKIAHRFTATDSAEESPKQEPAEAAQAERDLKPREPYARAPAMVRQILAPALPKTAKTSILDFDLAATRQRIYQNENLAGPAKALLDLGYTAMALGALALKTLVRFIKALLARLGFGTAAAPVGSEQAKTALPFLPVVDVESRFLHESSELNNRAAEASDQLQRVAEALKTNDLDLLPQCEGRAELIAALTAERTPFSVPSASDKTVDFLVGSENKQQSIDAALEVTTAELIDQFKTEVSEHQAAMAALKTATAPDLASLPFFLSQTKKAAEESELASAEADSAETEYLDWKAKNRLVSALVDPFGLKKRAEEAQEIAKKYAIALAKSKAEDTAFSLRAASLPPRAAPPEVVTATAATGERGRQTWARLKARMLSEILAAKAADPMLCARLDVLQAKLDRTRPAGLADPVKSVTFFKEFDSFCHDFLSVKAASFVLNQRVNSEFDEQVEKLSAPK